jgi:16S rRNA (uracil1498-N3)-methyltransferase
VHRFFVPAELLATEHVRLEGAVARQMGRVLRLSPGDRVTLLDGSGKEYIVRLRAFSRDAIEGEVEGVGDGRAEPRVHVTLYQGLLKGEKLEWVLQKGIELGVSAFVPLMCRRAVPVERRGWDARMERWRRIVTEAAEQCGRSRLPELREPSEFRVACDDARTRGGLAIIAWEREEAVGLSQALSGAKLTRVALFIGPEGGFEEDEVAYARSRGIAPVGLGRRILRAETAGLAAVAAIQYHLGELG